MSKPTNTPDDIAAYAATYEEHTNAGRQIADLEAKLQALNSRQSTKEARSAEGIRQRVTIQMEIRELQGVRDSAEAELTALSPTIVLDLHSRFRAINVAAARNVEAARKIIRGRIRGIFAAEDLEHIEYLAPLVRAEDHLLRCGLPSLNISVEPNRTTGVLEVYPSDPAIIIEKHNQFAKIEANLVARAEALAKEAGK